MNTTQTEAKWLPPGLPEWDLKYSVSGHDILERDRHWREEVFRLRSELARREEAEKGVASDVARWREALFTPGIPSMRLWELIAQQMFYEWGKADRKALPMGGKYFEPDQTSWDADGRTRAEFHAFARACRDTLKDQMEGCLSSIEARVIRSAPSTPSSAGGRG